MSRLLPYLQLLRLPTVFTAMADIFLGFLLTHRQGFQPALDFGLLLASSACLYLAGMVFNDVFDRRQDAEERPGRPIPSGRVSLTAAVGLGTVLIVAGLGAAQIVGLQSLFIAGGLTACILGYDAFLKRTPLGPVGMGCCRFLNVMLGASVIDGVETVRAMHIWVTPNTWVAALLGVYIVGVTWFARQEARQSSRWQLISAATVVNTGLAGLLALALRYPWPVPIDSDVTPAVKLTLFAVIALTINRRLAAAITDPAPHKVQPAIRTMLLSLVMIDATLVLAKTAEPQYAICVVALLVPAMLLSRVIPMT